MRAKLTVAREMAVAWAAIFVPFRQFLNPSIPQLLIIIGVPTPEKNLHHIYSVYIINVNSPLELQRLIIVLLDETFMLHTGRSANLTPLKSWSGVVSAMYIPLLLGWKNSSKLIKKTCKHKKKDNVKLI